MMCFGKSPGQFVSQNSPHAGRHPSSLRVSDHAHRFEPADPFSEACQVILVNLRGCAVRCTGPVKNGAIVELKGLPARATISARVINCICLAEQEKIWLLGLELETAGNWWGIEDVPPDWS
jgi:hypothetical protein